MDLEPWTWIVPCGLTLPMTSLAAETGRPGPLVPCLRRRVAHAYATERGMPSAPGDPGPTGPRPDRRDTGASVSGVSLPPTEREHQTRGRSNPGGMDVLQVLGTDVQPIRARKPPWFKVPAPGGVKYRELSKLISDENLHTVCQEAACPNVGECWERGTATFMILGDTCTRRCGFCNVNTGKPTWNDPLEPARVARSIAQMGLRHAVITSVDRDDLPDSARGSGRRRSASAAARRPTARSRCSRPTSAARRCRWRPSSPSGPTSSTTTSRSCRGSTRSRAAARAGSARCACCATPRRSAGRDVVTKSGLMVGLGETHDEMVGAFEDLRAAGVQVLTVGQYLRPTERHLPVVRYWHPDEFAALEAAAYDLGFDHIAAGPLVRSSYHADQHVPQPRPGVGPLAPAPSRRGASTAP